MSASDVVDVAPAPVAVIGAGSFGTALAIQLARRGSRTRLWGRNAAEMAEADRTRRNPRYLVDCELPMTLVATGDMDAALRDAEDIVIATPSHALRSTVEMLKPKLHAGQGVVIACKGFEPGTGKLSHEVVREVLDVSHPYAVLSGPTFANEMGRGLPTAVIIASKDDAFAKRVAHRLNGGGFRAYTGHDVIGVELGGAAKNVIAIAAGASDGLGFGANARSLLITRGLAEMRRLGEKMGAESETLMGLSGLGDLVLTCTDNQSRNRRLGLALAQGKTLTEALATIGQAVEGVQTSTEVLHLAQKLGIDMPITEQVYEVLHAGRSPRDAVNALLNREKKAEL